MTKAGAEYDGDVDKDMGQVASPASHGKAELANKG